MLTLNKANEMDQHTIGTFYGIFLLNRLLLNNFFFRNLFRFLQLSPTDGLGIYLI